ncbi:MAG TPA: HEPN domain-containing protein [Bacteroidales bacterium]|nr:HEPN domain-containing protein [Bacteroidales bacterium]
MTLSEKDEYVKYRMESARQTYDAAKVLASEGFWNSAVNRLYYSAFYAINALLVLNDIQSKSHSGTKSQFSLHFIKTGKFDKKFGQLFSELFDWRQKGDYDNIFDYDKESVEPLFEPVLELIDIIDDEIRQNI